MTFGNFGGHAGERRFNRYAQLVTADTEYAGTGADILSYKVGGTEGAVDAANARVLITLPAAQTDFTVTVTVSPGARPSLKQVEDSSGVSVWTVTAEDGVTVKDWEVHTTRPGGSGGGSGSDTGETGITVALPGTDKTGGITISSDRASWPDGVTRNAGENVHILEASDKTCDDYHWFVDGEQAIIFNSAETPPRTYQFKLTGGNYSTGKHKLVLAVVKNGIPYSVEVEFTVN